MEIGAGFHCKSFLYQEIKPLENTYRKEYNTVPSFSYEEFEKNKDKEKFKLGYFTGAIDDLEAIIPRMASRKVRSDFDYTEVVTLNRSKFAPFKAKLYHTFLNGKHTFTHFYDQWKASTRTSFEVLIEEKVPFLRALADGHALCIKTESKNEMKFIKKCYVMVSLCNQLFSSKYDLKMEITNDAPECYILCNSIALKDCDVKRINFKEISEDRYQFSIKYNSDMETNPLYSIYDRTSSKLKEIYTDNDGNKAGPEKKEPFELYSRRNQKIDVLLKKEVDDYKKQKLVYEIDEIKKEIDEKNAEMNAVINEKIKKQKDLKQKINDDIKTLKEILEREKEFNTIRCELNSIQKEISKLENGINVKKQSFDNALEQISGDFSLHCHNILDSEIKEVNNEITEMENVVNNLKNKMTSELKDCRGALDNVINQKEQRILENIVSNKQDVDDQLNDLECEIQKKNLEFKEARYIFNRQYDRIVIDKCINSVQKDIEEKKKEMIQFVNLIDDSLEKLRKKEISRCNELYAKVLKDVPKEVKRKIFKQSTESSSDDPFTIIL